MTETSRLPPMEALAYDLRRLLEADRATFVLSPGALLSHAWTQSGCTSRS